MKNIAFIPARLESKRFPNKVIRFIYGLPMIEHVRRRAILSNIFNKILIVSNSILIKKKLSSFKSKTILTKKKHFNGTSRVSEIAKKFNYDYGFVLFADEPFININMLKKCSKVLNKNKNVSVFNVVTNLKNGDMKSPQVVKSYINNKGYIIDYFRNSQNYYIKKNLKKSTGLLIIKKKILIKFSLLKIKLKEKKLKIEQFRFLENEIPIKSIFFKDIYPSINNKKEFNDLLKLIKKDRKEQNNLKKIKAIEY